MEKVVIKNRRVVYLSNNESIDDDSKRPYVNLIGMTGLAFEDFWSNVVWCAANRVFFLSVEFEFCSETKVTEFNFHFIVEEEVT